MSWSRSVAGPASPAEGVPGSLVSSPSVPDRCGQERPRAGRTAERSGDGQGPDRLDPRWAGGSALARGRSGDGCRAARIAQAPERPASGSIPPAPGSPACGRGTGPQPARLHALPAAAAPR